MGDSSMPEQQTVVVTGFGPFSNHAINASWVAVQELQKIGIGDNINLVIHELPVAYKEVEKQVPGLWEKHKPKLVVHVGVSGIASMLTLEQQAHNDGYDKCDIHDDIPQTKCCKDQAPGCLVSGLDMKCVCEKINNAGAGVKAMVSDDPGRYLCDFCYYTSLHIDQTCAAFIHVPKLDKPYSAEKLAKGLRLAIQAMLDQLT